MSRIHLLILGCLVAGVLVVGCSNDSPTTPGAGSDLLKTVISGEIDPAAATFTYAAAAPGEPSPGLVRIEGSNLRYEADPGRLLVDLVLVNDSDMDYPGPARLVFMQLMPEGVTVLNADSIDTNDVGAVSATVAFAFTGGDTLWRAGAATEPRTVEFGMTEITSVGFVSRILVGDEPTGGSIGGLVWHDMDGNGLVDEGEAGVRNIELILHAGPQPAVAAMLMRTRTDSEGHYSFAALAAGHYTVALAPDPRITPTTSPVLDVLLLEYEGQVLDFMGADFGVARADTTACVEVGDGINAKGVFSSDPDRLEAEHFNVCDHREDCDDDDGDYDDEDKSDDGMCWGRLSGPITGIDLELNAIAVMGTWVELSAEDWGMHVRDGDIVLGERVRVNAELVSDDDGDRVVACRVHRWNGDGDRVRGYVQEVVRDEDGIVGVVVLNTLVTVSDGSLCDAFDDDHDDEDGEDDDS